MGHVGTKDVVGFDVGWGRGWGRGFGHAGHPGLFGAFGLDGQCTTEPFECNLTPFTTFPLNGRMTEPFECNLTPFTIFPLYGCDVNLGFGLVPGRIRGPGGCGRGGL